MLYCLFWGILALVWIKELYPRLNGWIERSVSNRYGAAITWVLAVFMLVNSLVSGAAVMRWQQRYQGIPATQSWQTAMDQAYPDDVLSKIYPSMTRTQSKV